MLTNPVLISVLIMSALCITKVNVLIAIMISALVAGLIAHLPPIFAEKMANISSETSVASFFDTLMASITSLSKAAETTMTHLINGMGGNSQTALSYVLLGALAFAIHESGLAAKLSAYIEKIIGRNGTILIIILAMIACCSQNIIPIHIAFIPILIPPLLGILNELKIDRRAVACALTFGLKAPYIMIPAGFGLIFHGIIADQMVANGMPINQSDIWKSLFLPGAGMLLGLLFAIFISYRKPREYKQTSYDLEETAAVADKKLTIAHIGAIIGALCAFIIQLLTNSLPLGALIGILIMLFSGTIRFDKQDITVNGGINMMGFIAFVMLVAAGYGHVIRETKGVNELVRVTAGFLGNSKVMAASVMLLLGLVVTMGIGTSFGTIPILATIYVPLCSHLGFSAAATACLIGVAGALGDAGSPASDSTLGPTAGLNVDGQHDHIWDTCVPTFLHYNIPLLIFGVLTSIYL